MRKQTALTIPQLGANVVDELFQPIALHTINKKGTQKLGSYVFFPTDNIIMLILNLEHICYFAEKHCMSIIFQGD